MAERGRKPTLVQLREEAQVESAALRFELGEHDVYELAAMQRVHNRVMAALNMVDEQHPARERLEGALVELRQWFIRDAGENRLHRGIGPAAFGFPDGAA